MRLSIEIDMDNAAFEDDPGELGRILRDGSERVDLHLEHAPDTTFSCKLRDINGNTVGSVSLTETVS